MGYTVGPVGSGVGAMWFLMAGTYIVGTLRVVLLVCLILVCIKYLRTKPAGKAKTKQQDKDDNLADLPK